MKRNALKKKLVFCKETIADLESQQMKDVLGRIGIAYYTKTYDCCTAQYTNCASNNGIQCNCMQVSKYGIEVCIK